MEEDGVMGNEEHEMRTRSFRDEDYSNRRVFLRSYPLQWEKEDRKEAAAFKASLKNRFNSVFQWSEGKVLVLRRIKDKVAYYLVACYPYGFKSSNKMLTGF